MEVPFQLVAVPFWLCKCLRKFGMKRGHNNRMASEVDFGDAHVFLEFREGIGKSFLQAIPSGDEVF